MNSTEIHRIFDTIMDKSAEAVAYGGCPAFLPQEKDDYLNQAFLDIVSNKITGHNSTQMPFEATAKRVADLEGLIITDKDAALTVGNGSKNELVSSVFVTGNNGIKRWILVGLVIKFGEESIPCVSVNHTVVDKFKRSYNNDPWIENPVYIQEEGVIKVYYDTHMIPQQTGIKADITFVKEPKKIIYNSNEEYNEVPEQVMYEIIDRAVILALENIESRRTESKLQINTLSE